jgi:hypothetical protein
MEQPPFRIDIGISETKKPWVSKTHGLKNLKAMDGAKPSMAEHLRSHTCYVRHHQAHFVFMMKYSVLFDMACL